MLGTLKSLPGDTYIPERFAGLGDDAQDVSMTCREKESRSSVDQLFGEVGNVVVIQVDMRNYSRFMSATPGAIENRESER
jgi:hypothetical protein